MSKTELLSKTKLLGSTAPPKSRTPPPKKKNKKLPKPHETAEPVQQMAYSIKGFCSAHNLSIDLYFRIARAGTGPQVMKVGARTLISAESAAAWRHAREIAAQEQQRKNKHRVGGVVKSATAAAQPTAV